MALAARTVAAIQQRLIPCASAELIAACNALNTTISDDLVRRLNARLLRGVAVALTNFCAGASKGANILPSQSGADAIFIRGLSQWLNDEAAARDLVNTIATVN